MKFGAMLGWGIVIYAVMFLAWSGLMLHGLTGGTFPRILSLIVLVATATIAGRALGFRSVKDILPYSIAWAVIAGLFDAAYSVPFTGWGLYTDWNVWVGYGLVVLVPLFAPLTRSHSHPAELS